MILRRILAALAVLCCALVVPAQAQKTKAQIAAEIGVLFPDNTQGQITPLALRTVTTDLSNALISPAEVTVLRSNTSGASAWIASDAYGVPISCIGSTTSCVQEAINVAMPYALNTPLLGFDLNIIGGDEPGLGSGGSFHFGGGAAVVNVTAAPISFPPLQGKRIRSGAVTYNCGGCTGGTVLQFDALEMANIDFQGSQTVSTSNNSLVIKPTRGSPLDNGITVVDSKLYFKTLGGGVHFDWSGGGNGMGGTTFEVGELNGAALTSGCIFKIDSASTSGINVVGNRIIIDHLHGFGSGSTAMCIGTGAQTGKLGGNYYQVNINPDFSNTANGVDTWGSNDEWHLHFDTMNTGYSIKFESGACNNRVFITSSQASPIITDVAGCAAAAANIVIVNGSIVIGGNSTFNVSGFTGPQAIGTSSGGFNTAAVIAQAAVNAGYSWNATGGAADAKWWDAITAANTMNYRICSDAGSCLTWLQVTRSGNTISSIAFGNGTTFANVPISANDTLASGTNTLSLSNKTLTSPVISGGTIDSAVIGGVTPAAGSFTSGSFSGQIKSTFGTPTIASGACGTGTNGTLSGTATNQSGIITIGAAAATTCTVSFSTTITAPNACVIFPGNATAAAQGTTVARVGTPSTTAWVITGSALASTVYSYICL